MATEQDELPDEQYEQPAVKDYGTLQAMTEAITIVGPEDGGSKIDTDQHHSFAIP
jgi:hypothetical protein